MSEEACGIDVCLDIETIKSAPHCPHGPTLLFERYIKGKKSCKKFYACSASRDRKFCNFYQLLGDKHIKQKAEEEILEKDWILFPYTHGQCTERLKKIQLLIPGKRHICKSCGLLLLPEEVHCHSDHQVQISVSDDQLSSPTALLQPLTNNQTNAQFLFCDKTVNFLKDFIKATGIRRVLCVGTPRLFEVLSNDSQTECRPKCLLLDIDRRLEQFYSPSDFCRYNMFNHHFFGGFTSYSVYLRFLHDPSSSPNDLLVVMDPPFGGLVEVLAFSLNRIGQDMEKDQGKSDQQLPNTFWMFPYFMESKISKVLPSFSMLDYKVEYGNFSNKRSKGDKNLDTVRIFTNLDPSIVILPSSEGYRFCPDCKKYVASENKHCAKCKSCTTKVGNTYRHCDLCRRCVKPSWVHCFACSRCEIPNQHSQEVKLQGCHKCGLMDHKRQNCPLIESNATSSGRDHSRRRKKPNHSNSINTKSKRMKQRD